MIMVANVLSTKSIVIPIQGSKEVVVSTFLRVFLANSRLTDKQLEVTTELVIRYAEFLVNGVKEPYASILLFSAEARKEVQSKLEITAPHLNNTFNLLVQKEVLARHKGKYMMNPNIVPSNTLTFKFKVTDVAK
jgi:hypothetical protein